MPARYHTARNGVAISWQCSAYTNAPNASPSKPAPAPARAGNNAMLKGQVRHVLPGEPWEFAKAALHALFLT